jgi:hypothetical protein
MTPRERVICAMNYKQPDHTPHDYYAFLFDHFEIDTDDDL